MDNSSLLGILEKVDDAPSQLSHLSSVGYVLIGIGAFLLVIGFLGCCGAIKESKCMLLTFFIIVLIIFLVEVAGAIVLFVFQDVAHDLLTDVKDSISKTLEKDYGKDEALTDIWNVTMIDLKCCGINNYTDFTGSPFNENDLYPDPCCRNITGPCTEIQANQTQVEGCFDKVVQVIEENSVIIGAVAIGISVLEIAAMVVSMVLYKDIGNKA